MVAAIRQVETALGDGRKVPLPSEVKNMDIARKSLVANGEIPKGKLFSENNIAIKRPGDGTSPMRYWELIGNPATRNYKLDDRIDEHGS